MDDDDSRSARAKRIAAVQLLAPPLDELLRIKVESLQKILFHEATKQAEAEGVSTEQKEVLEANRDLLHIRVSEMLDNIAELRSSYRRLRMLAGVRDIMVGAFRIGAKGEVNAAIERALAEAARDQTAPGRSIIAIRVQERRAKLRPHIQKVLAENPLYDAGQVLKALIRLPRSEQPKELWDTKRTQQRKDIEAIVRELKAPKFDAA
jgi:hypothetical protein